MKGTKSILWTKMTILGLSSINLESRWKKGCIITILFFYFTVQVSMRRVRQCLVGANFVVLGAGIISLLSWQASTFANEAWNKCFLCSFYYLFQEEHIEDANPVPCDPMIDLPPQYKEDEALIKTFHTSLEGIMYLTAINQIFYWVIFGVVVSSRCDPVPSCKFQDIDNLPKFSRFGCSWSVWLLVMCLPYTLFLVAWQLGISLAILKAL